jgi:hypothetical protein
LISSEHGDDKTDLCSKESDFPMMQCYVANLAK